jgi:hypothetical protein
LSTAARLIVADGLPSERALERAASKLGIRLAHCRPSREQLSEAVREYRALFHPEQVDVIAMQRAAAVQLMRLLSRYRPRAAGSLVDGSDVPRELLLFVEADAIENLIHDLYDRRVNWRATEYSLRHASGRRAAHPALEVAAPELNALLVVLPANAAADPPCDPLDGRPMVMLDADALAALAGEGRPPRDGV